MLTIFLGTVASNCAAKRQKFKLTIKEVIMNTKFRDFLWVLQAFLRGKVLRQKVYQPQGNFFRLSVPVTARRNTMLMRWWGYRPATMAELYKAMRARAGHSYGSLVLTPSREELAEWEKHTCPDVGIRVQH